jgi:GT2 family glycosyltransferase
VVVVSYGDPSVLLANPLLRASRDWHVVVVENFSTIDNRAAAQVLAVQHGWDLVEPRSNLGFGAGANLGFSRAAAVGSDVVLFVNPDATLDAGSATTLSTYVRAHPDTLAAPRIVRADGSTWFAGGTLDLHTGLTRTTGRSESLPTTVPWLTGACLAALADSWARRGGFADEYFLYWEDIDLSVRWARSGGALAVLDEARCTHAVGATQHTTSVGAKSASYYYFNCRNRLLFARNHLTRGTRWRWALNALGYARAVLLRGGRRQLVHPRQTIVPAIRGTLAGLRLLWAGPATDRRRVK